MGEQRTINLNSAPLKLKKQHRTTDTNFHFRSDGIKIVGKKDDVQECKECHRILSLSAFTTHTLKADGAWQLLKVCRECKTTISSEQRRVRKNAPSKPDRCDCCHANKKLQIDHIHKTLIFRGWVCRNCNTGIGALGDNLKGILQAAVYLAKEKNEME